MTDVGADVFAQWRVVPEDIVALPVSPFIGICRCEGYGFQAVCSGIGYINQQQQQ